MRFKDTPFRRQGPSKVELLPARIEPTGVSIELRLEAPGARSVRVRFSLPNHEKALHIDMVIDKQYYTLAEAVYIPFPFALAKPQFHLDLNGVPMEPEAEQLPGSCRDWYGIHRWAEVNDGKASIVLTPIDSPLIQVGGITTGRWAEKLDTRNPMLVSWALHNHWDTNFKASQGENTLLRYRLTSREEYDAAEASRFAAEATVPPLIVRVPGASVGQTGQFLQVSPEGVAEVQLKRAADGRGLIVHAYNLADQRRELSLRFPDMTPRLAWVCSPIEEDQEAIQIVRGAIGLSVQPRSVACARVIF